jgi:hypothetical protein
MDSLQQSQCSNNKICQLYIKQEVLPDTFLSELAIAISKIGGGEEENIDNK